MLPNFLVIGAKKAGTKSLFEYLRTHPDVFVPDEKRLDFFSDVHWDRGVDWYASRFPDDVAARGEICNSYTHDPVVAGVPERARSVVPDAALVYLLRHPIERIESHYRQAAVEWGVAGSIDDAVRANPGEFVAPSRYGHQLARWREHFPAEQVTVLTSEDLRADPAATLAALFRAIGVDDGFVPPNVGERYNRAGDHRAQASALRRLRTSGPYQRVRSLVPGAVRRAAWRATSRPAPAAVAEARLAPDHRAELLDHLGPDLDLLAELVPGFHCWGLRDDVGTPT